RSSMQCLLRRPDHARGHAEAWSNARVAVSRRWGEFGLVALGVALGGPALAQSPAETRALPPVTVQPPQPSARPHPPPKRASRKPPLAASRAVVPNAAPQPPTIGSGAPNTGSGPTSPPSMASQTTATGEELNARPVTRPGEVLEAVPGLIVTQHSGEGKANQYFLRGYNLDHGTDLAITVDDVPVNMRTHAHGQGYADLNWL